MFSLDDLDSTEFEEFSYDLLSSMGFTNLSWRKGTGLSSSPSDQGRDIDCEYIVTDVDETQRVERWFVECKHYKKGVPATELKSALTWAQSEQVDVVLFIVSNFLSNPAKTFLRDFQANNKPRFKIKVWERPDLEKLTANKALLLRKYNIVGEFPFLDILHPAHLLYMRSIPINSLDFFLKLLDGFNTDKRDSILSWISGFLIDQPIIGRHTETAFGQTISLPERDHSVLTYENFQAACYELSKSLDEALIVFLVVTWILNCQVRISDTTSVDEFIREKEQMMANLKGEFAEKHMITDQDKEAVERMQDQISDAIKKAPENTQRNYDRYVEFCEKIVAPLLSEDLISRIDFSQLEAD